MLTNLFYYSFYRPYIMKDNNGSYKNRINGSALQARNYTPSSQEEYKTLILNKAYKSEIISYASNLSSNVTGLRDCIRDLGNSMRQFSRNLFYNGIGQAKEQLSEEIEDFISTFNNTCKFALSQDTSNELSLYAVKIEELFYDAYKNDERSIMFFDQDSNLVFNENYFKSLNLSRTNEEIEKLFDFTTSIEHETANLLELPLSEHLNFHSFGYYYNYQLGTVKENSFKLIESGFLLDRAI